MQFITITGNVGKDPVQRQTQAGESVTGFSVGVKQGWGDEASTNWFNCSIWGKRGATVAEYVRKGSKVTVCGEFSTREYEGKTQLEVRVSDIDWAKAEGSAPRQESRGGGGGGYTDDLDDDVPFITSSFAYEGRVG